MLTHFVETLCIESTDIVMIVCPKYCLRTVSSRPEEMNESSEGLGDEEDVPGAVIEELEEVETKAFDSAALDILPGCTSFGFTLSSEVTGTVYIVYFTE